MKNVIAGLGMAALLTTSALAADDGALPAGQPSGVSKAQGLLDNTPLLVLGGIAIIVGVCLATNSSSSASATST